MRLLFAARAIGAALFIGAIACSHSTTSAPLSYHGWALGISLDSAQRLAMRQTGDTLSCVAGDSVSAAFCFSDPTNRSILNVIIGRSAHPGITRVVVVEPLVVTADSLRPIFAAKWGSPNSTLGGYHADLRPQWIGHWQRGDSVAAVAAITVKDHPALAVTLTSATALRADSTDSANTHRSLPAPSVRTPTSARDYSP